MRAKKVIVVVALVFLVVMIGATVLYRLLGGGGAAGQLSGTESSAGPEASASQEPVDAPDFTVYDREDLGVASDFVHSIEEDSAGNIWVGTDRGAVVYDYHNDSFIPFKDFDGIPANLVGFTTRRNNFFNF